MIKSAEGSAGLFHKITSPQQCAEEECRSWREKKRMPGRKCAKCGDKPWTNEELKKFEEALPRLKECDLEKASGLYKAKNMSGMRRIPPESSLGLDKRSKKGNRRVPAEGGAEWKMAATSLYDDVPLDSEECYR